VTPRAPARTTSQPPAEEIRMFRRLVPLVVALPMLLLVHEPPEMPAAGSVRLVGPVASPVDVDRARLLCTQNRGSLCRIVGVARDCARSPSAVDGGDCPVSPRPAPPDVAMSRMSK
jgi:hypothetical protein